MFDWCQDWIEIVSQPGFRWTSGCLLPLQPSPCRSCTPANNFHACRWSKVSYWWNFDLIVVLRNRLFLPYSFDAVLHSRAFTGLEKAEIKRWKENPLVVPGVGWHTSRKVPRCTWSYQGPLRPGPKGPAVIRASWIKPLDNRIILEIGSSEFEIQNDFDLMQGSFFVWTID